jgi:tRNA-splicing endonuclease subunit Sen54
MLTPSLIPSTGNGPSITYHVYRQAPHFRKSTPGPPDFYISVIDATDALVPTEEELNSLLRQTPFHPPTQTGDLYGGALYQKLRTGYRHVILAVVDRGISSFLSLADAGFGNTPLWERETRTRGRGAKGGQRGRGRGRGQNK